MRSRPAGHRPVLSTAIGLMVLCLPVLARDGQPRAPAETQDTSHESGDPAKLSPDEIRTIWGALTQVEDSGTGNLKPGGRAELGPAGPGRVKISYTNGLDRYMALRQAELARDLGIRAWGVDFAGGPFLCWLEIEDKGQKTKRRMHEQPEGPPIDWVCSAERGRLLLWFLPGASEANPSGRSRRIMSRLKAADRFAGAIPEVFGLQVVGGPNVVFELHGDPKTPALWSPWNDVSIKEVPRPTPVRVNGEVTLLEAEATEKQPAGRASPRGLNITLKAKPQSKRR